MLKYLLSILLGVLFYSCAFAEGNLIFAIDIVRHGDRTPVAASPGMNAVWPQGLGQLTPKGMRQEYELGQFLRRKYVNKYHLLPDSYDTKSMNVRSSNLPRTMMSAQSILFGLYPLGTGPDLSHSQKALPQGLQPIPINTVSREQDSLLLPTYNKKYYKELLTENVFNNDDWVQKDLSLRSNYISWSQETGIAISSLFDLVNVGDRFFIERLYKIRPPGRLQENDADLMIDAGNWAFLKIMNNATLAVAIGRELAQKINLELNLATKKDRDLKYLLFAAHDTTIAAQLKLLGQNIDEIPPYASVLNYSLFENGSSNFEVRVTYNHKPVFIKQCSGYSCKLSDFINTIDEYLQ